MKLKWLLARLDNPGRDDDLREFTLREIKDNLERRNGFVYLLWMVDTPYYKIGVSHNPQQRQRQIGSVVLPADIALIHVLASNDMFRLETELHRRYADKLVRGEWYSLTGDDIACIQAVRRVDYTEAQYARRLLAASDLEI